MDSILTYVKTNIGLTEEDTAFDPNIISDINMALATLYQLGVGPEGGFAINDGFAVWSEFLPEEPKWNIVKTYVWKKVQLLFDPPMNASHLAALEREIAELEWRITNMV